MFSRQGRNSGCDKHKGTGVVYRCLKCVLLCLSVNLPAQSTTQQCCICMSHIVNLFVYPLAPISSGTSWYKAVYHSLEECWSVWSVVGQPGTGASCGKPPSYIWGLTSASALEPALGATAHNTAVTQQAQSSPLLRLLVTKNLYAKHVNLNSFLWVIILTWSQIALMFARWSY